MNQLSMQEHYRQQGYCLHREFYSLAAIESLHPVIERFHQAWVRANQDFYQKQAINSAYLTRPPLLNEQDRFTLFQWISDNQLIDVIRDIFPKPMVFLNSQLFFNPVNQTQTNYWHRDPQYHLSLAEQQASLGKYNVIHCRIPLFDEPGIELVPGTHLRWDSEEELEVRTETQGRSHSDDLSTGETVRLNAGDLLIFSADMIHRGLYGQQRLALDLLFCDPHPELLKHRDTLSMPGETMLGGLNNKQIFD